MRRITPIILASIMMLTFSSAALADEPAKYNFASAQGSAEINVTPNGESAASIYFYNIDGNRITHVVLEVSQAPANWQVTIQPPRGDTQVEINGQIVTVNENLYVEPSQALSQKVEDTPAGTVCIAVPSRGFALAKEAKIIVRVPASEKIGASSNITISATAQWLGQSGAAAITQNRDFTFSVEVVSAATGTQEKILGKTTVAATSQAPVTTTTEATGGVPGGVPGGSVPEGATRNWLPIIIGAAAVVIIVLLILLYISRRRD